MVFSPEHAHVALNHLPILGFAFAILPLIIYLFTKEKSAMLIALIMMCGSGLSIPIVMATGEKGEENFRQEPISQYIDDAGQEYLSIHYQHAETASKIMYVMTLLCFAGFYMFFKKQHLLKATAVVLIVVCCVNTALALWVADSGGKINHPEFRSEQKME